MIYKRPILRIVSAILIAAFGLSDISYAAPEAVRPISPSSLEMILNEPARFETPLNFSNLKEIKKGRNKTLILHIQDAHSNLSGQENLAATLDEIMTKYGVSLVLSEGGWGDCSLTQFKKIASPEIWKRVAKKYLMAGKIAGEEYLNLTSDHPMKIIGLEDKELYMTSVRNYAELADRREKILEFLNRLKAAVAKLKRKTYPLELLAYEDKKGRISDTEFSSGLEEFLKLAESRKFDLQNFPALKQLLALKAKEKTIDFKLASLEQAVLTEEIHDKGGKEDLAALFDQSKRSRNSRVSQFALFQKTFLIARNKNIPLDRFTNLAQYTDYLKDFSEIDLDKVLNEYERAEDELYRDLLSSRSVIPTEAKGRVEGSFVPDPSTSSLRSVARDDMASHDARLIRAIDRYLGLLFSAYKIQMTTKEFSLFQTNEPDFGTLETLAFVNRKLTEEGYAEDLLPLNNLLEDGKKYLEAFYDSVSKRDDAFVQNAERILTEENQKVAVLISGGYHTAHLKELLTKKGHSIAVLTPIVTSETNQKLYERELLSPLGRKIKVEVGSEDNKAKVVSTTGVKPLLLAVRSAPDAVPDIEVLASDAIGYIKDPNEQAKEQAKAQQIIVDMKPQPLPTGPSQAGRYGDVGDPAATGARLAVEKKVQGPESKTETSKKASVGRLFLGTLRSLVPQRKILSAEEKFLRSVIRDLGQKTSGSQTARQLGTSRLVELYQYLKINPSQRDGFNKLINQYLTPGVDLSALKEITAQWSIENHNWIHLVSEGDKRINPLGLREYAFEQFELKDLEEPAATELFNFIRLIFELSKYSEQKWIRKVFFTAAVILTILFAIHMHGILTIIQVYFNPEEVVSVEVQNPQKIKLETALSEVASVAVGKTEQESFSDAEELARIFYDVISQNQLDKDQKIKAFEGLLVLAQNGNYRIKEKAVVTLDRIVDEGSLPAGQETNAFLVLFKIMIDRRSYEPTRVYELPDQANRILVKLGEKVIFSTEEIDRLINTFFDEKVSEAFKVDQVRNLLGVIFEAQPDSKTALYVSKRLLEEVEKQLQSQKETPERIDYMKELTTKRMTLVKDWIDFMVIHLDDQGKAELSKTLPEGDLAEELYPELRYTARDFLLRDPDIFSETKIVQIVDKVIETIEKATVFDSINAEVNFLTRLIETGKAPDETLQKALPVLKKLVEDSAGPIKEKVQKAIETIQNKMAEDGSQKKPNAAARLANEKDGPDLQAARMALEGSLKEPSEPRARRTVLERGISDGARLAAGSIQETLILPGNLPVTVTLSQNSGEGFLTIVLNGKQTVGPYSVAELEGFAGFGPRKILIGRYPKIENSADISIIPDEYGSVLSRTQLELVIVDGFLMARNRSEKNLISMGPISFDSKAGYRMVMPINIDPEDPDSSATDSYFGSDNTNFDGKLSEPIEEQEAKDILRITEVHGDKFLKRAVFPEGRRLTVQILEDMGMQPSRRAVVNGQEIFIAAKIYQLSEHRLATIAYVPSTSNGEKIYVARTYYTSGSSINWRYLPAVFLDPFTETKANWYDKGYDEQSVTAPFEYQWAFYSALNLQENIEYVDGDEDDKKLLFFGTSRSLNVRPDPAEPNSADSNSPASWSYYGAQGVDSKPAIQMAPGQPGFLPQPKEVVVGSSDHEPDFKKKIVEIPILKGPHTGMTQRVYKSMDNKLIYTFADNVNLSKPLAQIDPIAFIPSVEMTGRMTDAGVRKSWPNAGALVTPYREYPSQSFGYGGEYVNEKYVDMFRNYISRIPVIRRYFEEVLKRSLPIKLPEKSGAVDNEPKKPLVKEPITFEFLLQVLDEVKAELRSETENLRRILSLQILNRLEKSFLSQNTNEAVQRWLDILDALQVVHHLAEEGILLDKAASLDLAKTLEPLIDESVASLTRDPDLIRDTISHLLQIWNAAEERLQKNRIKPQTLDGLTEMQWRLVIRSVELDSDSFPKDSPEFVFRRPLVRGILRGIDERIPSHSPLQAIKIIDEINHEGINNLDMTTDYAKEIGARFFVARLGTGWSQSDYERFATDTAKYLLATWNRVEREVRNNGARLAGEKETPELQVARLALEGSLKVPFKPRTANPTPEVEFGLETLSTTGARLAKNVPGPQYLNRANQLSIVAPESESATAARIAVQKPIVDMSPRPEKVKEWIDAQPTAELKKLSTFLADNITYIDQEAFELELKKTIESFQRFSTNPFALVAISGEKSNEWVYGLALEAGLSAPADKIFSSKEGLSKAVTVWLKDSRNKDINDLLYIDDASYSGRQIDNWLTTLSINLITDPELEKRSIRIHVAIPFMTKNSKDDLQSLVDSINQEAGSEKIKLIFHDQARLRNIEDILSSADSDVRETFVRVLGGNQDGKTLTYFQHKKPDYYSAPYAFVSEGTVFDGPVFDTSGQVVKKIPFIPPIEMSPYQSGYVAHVSERMAGSEWEDRLLQTSDLVTGPPLAAQMLGDVKSKGLAPKDSNQDSITELQAARMALGGEKQPLPERLRTGDRPADGARLADARSEPASKKFNRKFFTIVFAVLAVFTPFGVLGLRQHYGITSVEFPRQWPPAVSIVRVYSKNADRTIEVKTNWRLTFKGLRSTEESRKEYYQGFLIKDSRLLPDGTMGSKEIMYEFPDGARLAAVPQIRLTRSERENFEDLLPRLRAVKEGIGQVVGKSGPNVDNAKVRFRASVRSLIQQGKEQDLAKWNFSLPYPSKPGEELVPAASSLNGASNAIERGDFPGALAGVNLALLYITELLRYDGLYDEAPSKPIALEQTSEVLLAPGLAFVTDERWSVIRDEVEKKIDTPSADFPEASKKFIYRQLVGKALIKLIEAETKDRAVLINKIILILNRIADAGIMAQRSDLSRTTEGVAVTSLFDQASGNSQFSTIQKTAFIMPSAEDLSTILTNARDRSLKVAARLATTVVEKDDQLAVLQGQRGSEILNTRLEQLASPDSNTRMAAARQIAESMASDDPLEILGSLLNNLSQPKGTEAAGASFKPEVARQNARYATLYTISKFLSPTVKSVAKKDVSDELVRTVRDGYGQWRRKNEALPGDLKTDQALSLFETLASFVRYYVPRYAELADKLPNSSAIQIAGRQIRSRTEETEFQVLNWVYGSVSSIYPRDKSDEVSRFIYEAFAARLASPQNLAKNDPARYEVTALSNGMNPHHRRIKNSAYRDKQTDQLFFAYSAAGSDSDTQKRLTAYEASVKAGFQNQAEVRLLNNGEALVRIAQTYNDAEIMQARTRAEDFLLLMIFLGDWDHNLPKLGNVHQRYVRSQGNGDVSRIRYVYFDTNEAKQPLGINGPISRGFAIHLRQVFTRFPYPLDRDYIDESIGRLSISEAQKEYLRDGVQSILVSKSDKLAARLADGEILKRLFQNESLSAVRESVTRLIYYGAGIDRDSVVSLMKVFPRISDVYLIDRKYQNQAAEDVIWIQEAFPDQVKIHKIPKDYSALTAQDLPPQSEAEHAVVVDKKSGDPGLKSVIQKWAKQGDVVVGFQPIKATREYLNPISWKASLVQNAVLPSPASPYDKWTLSMISIEDFETQPELEAAARLAGDAAEDSALVSINEIYQKFKLSLQVRPLARVNGQKLYTKFWFEAAEVSLGTAYTFQLVTSIPLTPEQVVALAADALESRKQEFDITDSHSNTLKEFVAGINWERTLLDRSLSIQESVNVKIDPDQTDERFLDIIARRPQPFEPYAVQVSVRDQKGSSRPLAGIADGEVFETDITKAAPAKALVKRLKESAESKDEPTSFRSRFVQTILGNFIKPTKPLFREFEFFDELHNELAVKQAPVADRSDPVRDQALETALNRLDNATRYLRENGNQKSEYYQKTLDDIAAIRSKAQQASKSAKGEQNELGQRILLDLEGLIASIATRRNIFKKGVNRSWENLIGRESYLQLAAEALRQWVAPEINEDNRLTGSYRIEPSEFDEWGTQGPLLITLPAFNGKWIQIRVTYEADVLSAVLMGDDSEPIRSTTKSILFGADRRRAFRALSKVERKWNEFDYLVLGNGQDLEGFQFAIRRSSGKFIIRNLSKTQDIYWREESAIVSKERPAEVAPKAEPQIDEAPEAVDSLVTRPLESHVDPKVFDSRIAKWLRRNAENIRWIVAISFGALVGLTVAAIIIFTIDYLLSFFNPIEEPPVDKNVPAEVSQGARLAGSTLTGSFDPAQSLRELIATEESSPQDEDDNVRQKLKDLQAHLTEELDRLPIEDLLPSEIERLRNHLYQIKEFLKHIDVHYQRHADPQRYRVRAQEIERSRSAFDDKVKRAELNWTLAKHGQIWDILWKEDTSKVPPHIAGDDAPLDARRYVDWINEIARTQSAASIDGMFERIIEEQLAGEGVRVGPLVSYEDVVEQKKKEKSNRLAAIRAQGLKPYESLAALANRVVVGDIVRFDGREAKIESAREGKVTYRLIEPQLQNRWRRRFKVIPSDVRRIREGEIVTLANGLEAYIRKISKGRLFETVSYSMVVLPQTVGRSELERKIEPIRRLEILNNAARLATPLERKWDQFLNKIRTYSEEDLNKRLGIGDRQGKSLRDIRQEMISNLIQLKDFNETELDAVILSLDNDPSLLALGDWLLWGYAKGHMTLMGKVMRVIERDELDAFKTRQERYLYLYSKYSALLDTLDANPQNKKEVPREAVFAFSNAYFEYIEDNELLDGIEAAYKLLSKKFPLDAELPSMTPAESVLDRSGFRVIGTSGNVTFVTASSFNKTRSSKRSLRIGDFEDFLSLLPELGKAPYSFTVALDRNDNSALDAAVFLGAYTPGFFSSPKEDAKKLIVHFGLRRTNRQDRVRLTHSDRRFERLPELRAGDRRQYQIQWIGTRMESWLQKRGFTEIEAKLLGSPTSTGELLALYQNSRAFFSALGWRQIPGDDVNRMVKSISAPEAARLAAAPAVNGQVIAGEGVEPFLREVFDDYAASLNGVDSQESMRQKKARVLQQARLLEDNIGYEQFAEDLNVILPLTASVTPERLRQIARAAADLNDRYLSGENVNLYLDVGTLGPGGTIILLLYKITGREKYRVSGRSYLTEVLHLKADTASLSSGKLGPYFVGERYAVVMGNKSGSALKKINRVLEKSPREYYASDRTHRMDLEIRAQEMARKEFQSLPEGSDDIIRGQLDQLEALRQLQFLELTNSGFAGKLADTPQDRAVLRTLGDLTALALGDAVYFKLLEILENFDEDPSLAEIILSDLSARLGSGLEARDFKSALTAFDEIFLKSKDEIRAAAANAYDLLARRFGAGPIDQGAVGEAVRISGSKELPAAARLAVRFSKQYSTFKQAVSGDSLRHLEDYLDVLDLRNVLLPGDTLALPNGRRLDMRKTTVKDTHDLVDYLVTQLISNWEHVQRQVDAEHLLALEVQEDDRHVLKIKASNPGASFDFEKASAYHFTTTNGDELYSGEGVGLYYIRAFFEQWGIGTLKVQAGDTLTTVTLGKLDKTTISFQPGTVIEAEIPLTPLLSKERVRRTDPARLADSRDRLAPYFEAERRDKFNQLDSATKPVSLQDLAWVADNIDRAKKVRASQETEIEPQALRNFGYRLKVGAQFWYVSVRQQVLDRPGFKSIVTPSIHLSRVWASESGQSARRVFTGQAFHASSDFEASNKIVDIANTLNGKAARLAEEEDAARVLVEQSLTQGSNQVRGGRVSQGQSAARLAEYKKVDIDLAKEIAGRIIADAPTVDGSDILLTLLGQDKGSYSIAINNAFGHYGIDLSSRDLRNKPRAVTLLGLVTSMIKNGKIDDSEFTTAARLAEQKISSYYQFAAPAEQLAQESPEVKAARALVEQSLVQGNKVRGSRVNQKQTVDFLQENVSFQSFFGARLAQGRVKEVSEIGSKDLTLLAKVFQRDKDAAEAGRLYSFATVSPGGARLSAVLGFVPEGGVVLFGPSAAPGNFVPIGKPIIFDEQTLQAAQDFTAAARIASVSTSSLEKLPMDVKSALEERGRTSNRARQLYQKAVREGLVVAGDKTVVWRLLTSREITAEEIEHVRKEHAVLQSIVGKNVHMELAQMTPGQPVRVYWQSEGIQAIGKDIAQVYSSDLSDEGLSEGLILAQTAGAGFAAINQLNERIAVVPIVAAGVYLVAAQRLNQFSDILVQLHSNVRNDSGVVLTPKDWERTRLVTEPKPALYKPLALRILEKLDWNAFLTFVQEAAKAQLALGAAA